LPIGALVDAGVALSDALAQFGFLPPESTCARIEQAGSESLIQATLALLVSQSGVAAR
jgi:hypothetical protein